MARRSDGADRLAALAALGLGPTADARDILSAYRQLARLSHPDMTDSAVSGHDFAAISAAYHFLTRGPGPLGASSTRNSPNAKSAPQPEDAADGPSPVGGPESLAEPPLWPSPPVAGERRADPMFAAGPVIIRPLPPETR